MTWNGVEDKIAREQESKRSVHGPDVPGVAHHELKVVIVVDGGTDVAVVAAELCARDLAVLVRAIEGVEELPEDLIFAALACMCSNREDGEQSSAKQASNDGELRTQVQRRCEQMRCMDKHQWRQRHRCRHRHIPLITSGCLEASYLAEMSATSIVPFLSARITAYSTAQNSI